MCGSVGVDTVSTLAHLADDKTLFRAAFTLTVGLDPNTGPKVVQMSHVVGAYSAAYIRPYLKTWMDGSRLPCVRWRQARRMF